MTVCEYPRPHGQGQGQNRAVLGVRGHGKHLGGYYVVGGLVGEPDHEEPRLLEVCVAVGDVGQLPLVLVGLGEEDLVDGGFSRPAPAPPVEDGGGEGAAHGWRGAVEMG